MCIFSGKRAEYVDLIFSRHDDFVMGVRYLFKNDLRQFDFSSDLTSDPIWAFNHVDLPRIKEGRLGGQVSTVLFSVTLQILLLKVH